MDKDEKYREKLRDMDDDELRRQMDKNKRKSVWEIGDVDGVNARKHYAQLLDEDMTEFARRHSNREAGAQAAMATFSGVQVHNETISEAGAFPNGPTSTITMEGGEETVAGSRPLQMSVVLDGETQKVQVLASTIAGGSSADLGFASGVKLLTPSAGVLQGKVTINGTTGEVTARTLTIVSTLDTNSSTVFNVEVGTVFDLGDGVWGVANSRYGPIDAKICRDWYVSPATYFVDFTGS